MPVIDEIYVRDADGTNRVLIDSYDNKVIDEIVIDGESYHFAKEATATGTNTVTCDDAVVEPLINCVIGGNSFQDGTPTPDAPVEVQSVGELVTDENDINFGKYKIPVVQRGIHAVNPKTFVGSNLVDNGDGSYTLTRTASERFGAYNRKVQSIPIGTRLILKVNILDTNYKTPRLNVMIQWADGTILYTAIHSSYAYEFPVSKQLNYIVFYVHTDEAVGSYITFNELILGYADDFKEYEPYAEPVTTNIYLDEPLRKIGDYADYLDYKNNKIIRSIHKRAVVSSDASWWQLNVNKENILSIYRESIINSIYVGNYQILCELFPYKHWNSITGTDVNLVWCAGSSAGFYIDTNLISGYDYSWANWKKKEWFLKWAESIGLHWYLARKTPIEEPLNIDLPKLTPRTCYIEVGTSLAPNSVTADYWKQIIPNE